MFFGVFFLLDSCALGHLGFGPLGLWAPWALGLLGFGPLGLWAPWDFEPLGTFALRPSTFCFLKAAFSPNSFGFFVLVLTWYFYWNHTVA